MLLNGKVGPRRMAPGGEGPLRIGRDSEVNVGQIRGKYAEAVAQGAVFAGGTNPTTGVAPGTAVGTTAAFTLANPAGSGKNLVVMRVSLGFVSGTLGAGVIHYLANVNPIAAAVTGTAISVTNCLLGSRIAGVGLLFTTATLPAAPTPLRPFAWMPAMAAATALAPSTITEDVDGEFIVAPGCALSLHGSAGAGGSPLVMFGMTWEEVAI